MHAYRDQYASLFQGGRNVVLISISTDSAQELMEWARDDEFPFLMGSDEGGAVGRAFGIGRERNGVAMNGRAAFVVNPEGRISFVASPFREIDPTAYEELGAAIAEVAVSVDGGEPN